MKNVPVYLSPVLLSEEDRKEVADTIKQIKKMKTTKNSYFTGFKEAPMKKPRKSKKAAPLKGFLQSGILFIGDPVYMSGDLSQPGSELLESRENPFLNWGRFTDGLGDKDVSLPFPGAIEEGSTGRGIAVQTNHLSGRFEIKKKLCPKTGKLLQIVVKFYE